MEQAASAEDLYRLSEPGSTAARDKAIVGSGLRVGGYSLGLLLTAGSGVILLHYLGVAGSGRYITVTALIGIVGGITDAGLTLVGLREYLLLAAPEPQRQLTAAVLAVRLIITPVAVMVALLFALLAGYGFRLVAGLAICGTGLLLLNMAYSLALPLQASMRLGAITATDLVRNVVITVGIAVLAATRCGFVTLFVPQAAGGAVALFMTLALVGRRPISPSFDWGRIWSLTKAATPVAASLALNVVYFRVLIILMSLLASAHATGVYGASYRVIESLAAVPVLIVGATFPILVHAGQGDDERLKYVLQRLAEVGVLVGSLMAITAAIAARPVVLLLGGHGFGAAAAVLQIQCFALVPAFLTQVWSLGLVALHRQRALIGMNVVALTATVCLGIFLIPLAGANGAGLAAVGGETALAAAALFLLVGTRRDLKPSLVRLPRIALSVVFGAAPAWLPMPAILCAVAGAVAFCISALVLRAVPAELVDLVLSRGRDDRVLPGA